MAGLRSLHFLSKLQYCNVVLYRIVIDIDIVMDILTSHFPSKEIQFSLCVVRTWIASCHRKAVLLLLRLAALHSLLFWELMRACLLLCLQTLLRTFLLHIMVARSTLAVMTGAA